MRFVVKRRLEAEAKCQLFISWKEKLNKDNFVVKQSTRDVSGRDGRIKNTSLPKLDVNFSNGLKLFVSKFVQNAWKRWLLIIVQDPDKIFRMIHKLKFISWLIEIKFIKIFQIFRFKGIKW